MPGNYKQVCDHRAAQISQVMISNYLSRFTHSWDASEPNRHGQVSAGGSSRDTLGEGEGLAIRTQWWKKWNSGGEGELPAEKKT